MHPEVTIGHPQPTRGEERSRVAGIESDEEFLHMNGDCILREVERELEKKPAFWRWGQPETLILMLRESSL